MSRTLEEALELGQLRRVVELPEVLRLLGQVLALHGGVSLVCDDVGCGVVEVLDQGREVDVCRWSVSMDGGSRQEGIDDACDALLHAEMAC